jgi:hypothetical protein
MFNSKPLKPAVTLPLNAYFFAFIIRLQIKTLTNNNLGLYFFDKTFQ